MFNNLTFDLSKISIRSMLIHSDIDKILQKFLAYCVSFDVDLPDANIVFNESNTEQTFNFLKQETNITLYLSSNTKTQDLIIVAAILKLLQKNKNIFHFQAIKDTSDQHTLAINAYNNVLIAFALKEIVMSANQTKIISEYIFSLERKVLKNLSVIQDDLFVKLILVYIAFGSQILAQTHLKKYLHLDNENEFTELNELFFMFEEDCSVENIVDATNIVLQLLYKVKTCEFGIEYDRNDIKKSILFDVLDISLQNTYFKPVNNV